MLRAHFAQASVINDGLDSSNSELGDSRIGASLAPGRPAFTLILYGTNDWSDPRCGQPCFTIDRLRSMARQVKAQGGALAVADLQPVAPTRLAAYLDAWWVLSRFDQLLTYAVALGGQPRPPQRSAVDAALLQLSLAKLISIDRNGDIYEQYKLTGLPDSFFVGRDGNVAALYYGFVTEEIARERLRMAGLE